MLARSLLGTSPIHISTCTSILNVRMFLLVTEYTLWKFMSANAQRIVAVTSRVHCQRQGAFFKQIDPLGGGRQKITILRNNFFCQMGSPSYFSKG